MLSSLRAVKTQTTLNDPAPYYGHDVGYLDVEVLEGVRGVAAGTSIRVWDGGFGSSCSVDLRPLKAGTLVALALMRNKPQYSEYQQLMRLAVGPEDYLLEACGDYKRSIGADEDIAPLVALLRNAVGASRKGRRTTRCT